MRTLQGEQNLHIFSLLREDESGAIELSDDDDLMHLSRMTSQGWKE